MSSNANNRLRASTLPELLVVMILTVVVLLAVVDGLNLFSRFSHIVMERIERNGERWSDYYLLQTQADEPDPGALPEEYMEEEEKYRNRYVQESR